MPALRRPALVAVLLSLFAVSGAAPAWATVTIPLDLRDLVAAASSVVYGRVVQTRVVDRGGRPATVVTVGMTAFLKGQGGRTVEFLIPGGQQGRYRTIVVGAPVVDVGDEIVVFLNEAGHDLPSVVGFSQGVLRVARADGAAAPRVLAPPVARDGVAQRVVRGAGSRRFVDLATFVEDVRALAAQRPHDDGHRHTGRPVPREGR